LLYFLIKCGIFIIWRYIMPEEKEEHVCCICKKRFKGHGNNPEPVKSEGRCCDECNETVVITARIEKIMETW
jgi:hypothetical protein